ITDLDDAIFLAKVTAGNLEGLHDAHGLFHAVHGLEGVWVQFVFVRADDADDGACFAAAEMDLVPHLLHSFDHRLDLIWLGVSLHDDDHAQFLSDSLVIAVIASGYLAKFCCNITSTGAWRTVCLRRCVLTSLCAYVVVC